VATSTGTSPSRLGGLIAKHNHSKAPHSGGGVESLSLPEGAERGRRERQRVERRERAEGVLDIRYTDCGSRDWRGELIRVVNEQIRTPGRRRLHQVRKGRSRSDLGEHVRGEPLQDLFWGEPGSRLAARTSCRLVVPVGQFLADRDRLETSLPSVGLQFGRHRERDGVTRLGERSREAEHGMEVADLGDGAE
jgi:hypothetical protein